MFYTETVEDPAKNTQFPFFRWQNKNFRPLFPLLWLAATPLKSGSAPAKHRALVNSIYLLIFYHISYHTLFQYHTSKQTNIKKKHHTHTHTPPPPTHTQHDIKDMI